MHSTSLLRQVSDNVIADVPLCRASLHLTCLCISTWPPCCSQVKLPHTLTMSLSLQVAISQPFPWLLQGRATSKSGTIMVSKQLGIFKTMNNNTNNNNNIYLFISVLLSSLNLSKICQPADLCKQNIFGVWFQGDLSSSVGRGMYCGEEFQAIKPRVASQRLKPTQNTRVRVRLMTERGHESSNQQEIGWETDWL